jgi:CelD/BcsL family acetyltransferase involved in cellulose biosynthesis
LTNLRDEWRNLQRQCPDATPYQSWEWCDAWWRHFGSRKRPRIILFRSSSGQLIGIAPLYVSWHLGTPVRRLAWIGTGASDYLEPLAHPVLGAEVGKALLSYIQADLTGWDIADLQQLRPCASLLEAVSPAVAHRALMRMEPCPFLTLPGSWEEFTGRLGKKMRSNLGYYERLLYKSFPDARHIIADSSSLQEGMTALFELHQSRWNARWLPGVLGSRRTQAFHRDVAERFLENGWLRLHLIYADGALLSALYCFRVGSRTLYYLGGFSPNYAKYSLGTVLTAMAIRHAIEEGCTEFDFLRGNEEYKYRWLPEERFNQRLVLTQSRTHLGGLGELPGKAGFALNRVERYVEHRAKVFAEHHGRPQPTPRPGGKSPLSAVARIRRRVNRDG